MSLKAVRRRCEEILRGVSVPSPFDVEAFCTALSERRARRIHLCPMTMGISPCGVWLALPGADYIFYEEGTTRLHREHIVLHELGHVLSDHVPTDVLDEELVKALMPDLDFRMVQRVLGRTSYSAVEEQEAEMLASLVLERARRGTVIGARTAAPEVANVLDRLESTLKGRAG